MNELTQFQAASANIALHKLLHGTIFFISDFDALAKLIGKEVGGRDYDALRGLHCIKWAELPEPLQTQVREKIIELLGIQPPPIEAVKVHGTTTENKTSGVSKLLFWKDK